MKNKVLILISFFSNFTYSMQPRPQGRMIKGVISEDNTFLSKEIIDMLSTKKPQDIQKAYEMLQSMGISECTDRGCSLIRSKSISRHLFEQTLIDKFIIPNFSKDQTLIYTSLGSGLLFQDLVILSKLIKQGFKKIHINLIDNLYAIRGLISQRQLNAQQTIKEFATIMQNIPNTQITIIKYGSEDDYLADVRNKYAKMSDVLISIDAQINFCKDDDRILIKNGVKENGIYASLSDETCFRKKKLKKK